MNTPAVTTPDIEDNWFSLIEEIKAGTVIPVIGPDLLEIEVGDASDLRKKIKVRDSTS